jgi:putative PEP-CTERM system TPR-repeat lipoprotein
VIGERVCGLWVVALALCATACAPPSPEELMSNARAALQAGEPRTAEIHLKNLLEREPTRRDARELLGEASLQTGDFAGAEHHFRTALELGAEPATVELSLLQAMFAQEKFSEVQQRIESMPPLAGSERATQLGLLGAAEAKLRHFDRAAVAYEEALAVDPDSLPVRTELAAVRLDLGQAQAARSAIGEVLTVDPSFAPALLLRGLMEMREGRRAAARATFERVLALEHTRRNGAQYGTALARLAELHLAEHDLAAAGAAADELIELNPRVAVAIEIKARVEVEAGELDSAERRLESLIANNEHYWPAYVLLGLINANQGQLGQAEMYLRRAVNNNPSDVRSQVLLAELFIRRSDVDGARRLIDESPGSSLMLALMGRASLEAGQRELAAEYFARSELSPPGTAQELVDVSSAYLAAGELERAIRVLEGASGDGGDNERLANYLLTFVQLRRGNLAAADATASRLDDQRPETLNLRGTIAMRARDLSRARAFYEEALGIAPDYVPALLNLARVAVAQDKRPEAEVLLKKVIDIDPGQISAIFGMAQLTMVRGAYDEAEAWLDRAPESVLRRRLMGDLRFEQERFDVAAADYGVAYGLRPNVDLALRSFAALTKAGRANPETLLSAWSDEHPNDAQANFALGTVALERGERDVAARRYERVIEVEPRHFPALNNLAWIYSELGDPRALATAERAHELNSNDPSASDTLGWILLSRGDVGAALPLLEKSVADRPDNPEIRYHWAAALAKSGDPSRAVVELVALLDGYPEFASRGLASELLAELRLSAGRP